MRFIAYRCSRFSRRIRVAQIYNPILSPVSPEQSRVATHVRLCPLSTSRHPLSPRPPSDPRNDSARGIVDETIRDGITDAALTGRIRTRRSRSYREAAETIGSANDGVTPPWTFLPSFLPSRVFCLHLLPSSRRARLADRKLRDVYGRAELVRFRDDSSPCLERESRVEFRTVAVSMLFIRISAWPSRVPRVSARNTAGDV